VAQKECKVCRAIKFALSHDPAASLVSVKHCYLAVFMLCDKARKASRFHAYYCSLPGAGGVTVVEEKGVTVAEEKGLTVTRGARAGGLDSMAVFWSPEDLEQLRGSKILLQIEDRKVTSY
jgi:hypothetical protein